MSILEKIEIEQKFIMFYTASGQHFPSFSNFRFVKQVNLYGLFLAATVLVI